MSAILQSKQFKEVAHALVLGLGRDVKGITEGSRLLLSTIG